MYIYIYVYIYTYMYIYIYVYIYTYMYIDVYIYADRTSGARGADDEQDAAPPHHPLPRLPLQGNEKETPGKEILLGHDGARGA